MASSDQTTSYRDYVAQNDAAASAAGAKPEKKKSPFDKLGVLTKLGGNVKNWLERGFALRSDYKLLHYFRSARDFKLFAENPQKNSNKIAGTINLINARMFLATYMTFDNCLEITTAPPELRHYYVYAKTAQEIRAWINKLASAGVTFVGPSLSLCVEELKILPDPPAPQPVLGMQGFIEKRGTFNTAFQVRFFRIEETPQVQTLAWYKRYDDTKPKGFIPLSDCRVVEEIATASAEENKELQWGVETKSRLYVLRSRNKKEKQLWVDVLKAFLKYPTAPAPLLNADGDDPDSVTDEKDPDVNGPVPAHLDLDNGASPSNDENPVFEKDTDGKAFGDYEQEPGQPDADSKVADKEPSIKSVPSGLGASAAMILELEQQRLAEERAKKEAAQKAAGGGAPSAGASPAVVVASAATTAPAAAAAPSQEALAEAKSLLGVGAKLLKFGRKGNPHFKWVKLVDSRLFWSEPEHKKEDPTKCVDLKTAKSIAIGKETAVLKREVAKNTDTHLCFSILEADRTLDLAADSVQKRDKWVAALELLLQSYKN